MRRPDEKAVARRTFAETRPDACSTGEGLPLVDPVDRGIIRILDPVCVTKEQPAPAPAQPSSDDEMSGKLAQLRELGELKSQGVLTESEFQAQKSRILGS
ncbi:SHOCT domain-containing protein [Embleya sp. NPDC008237]|uniref:SHOCT domain-containing protein n=1 Tax=Embleya sp. NPDC008237 TaxID=3363978 RepID=UPI0036E05BA8